MKLNVKILSGMLSVFMLSLTLFSVPAMASETTTVEFQTGQRNKVVFSGSVDVKPDENNETVDSALKAEDSERFGSISIQLEETKNKDPRGKVKFSIAKVADVIDGEFVLTEAYKKSNIDLNAIESANELEMAAAALAEIEGERNFIITNDDGFAKTADLSVGVYLICAEDKAEYEDITPFLISIPTWNEESKHMIYDVIAYPKHSAPKKPSGHNAPGTGVENDSLKYLLISGGLAISAGIVYVAFGRKKEI